MSAAATRFRQLLERPGPVVLPGVYDGISVRSVEAAGFEAAFVSGAAVTASVLGYPDVGLQTMPEILQQVRHMARAVDIPLLVDIDTGYGNALNMTRTIREFEDAGAAGVFFEDQTFPKKCGHFEGKDVVPAEEMIAKIKAACDTRRNKDLVIVARTDARASYGLDAAIERAGQYVEAGADVIYVEALLDREEFVRVRAAVPGPLQANMSEGNKKTPMLTVSELDDLGFKLVSYSGLLQRTAVRGMERVLAALREEGSAMSLFPEHICDLVARSRLLDLDSCYRIQEKYYGAIRDTEKSWRASLSKTGE